MLTPDWPAPSPVRAACSTREGGVSGPPWNSLNLGDHVGDDPIAVEANRQRYAQALGSRPVFLRQVHGSQVLRLRADTIDGQEADACVATVPGVACTILVADCLPVLLCDEEGRAVAAAHAGWRGLAGQGGRGVLEAVLEAMSTALRLPSDQPVGPRLLAWLGPCIGPSAFEVGPEVKQAFESRNPAAGALFKPLREGKWLADLPGLARQRLQAAGVIRIHGNDGSADWCTHSQPSRFFSHRRDRISGRLAVSAWLA